jgi:hypothetical protein
VAVQRTSVDETGVEIDILTQGQDSGDGKPKPVLSQIPSNASTEIDGIRILMRLAIRGWMSRRVSTNIISVQNLSAK